MKPMKQVMNRAQWLAGALMSVLLFGQALGAIAATFYVSAPSYNSALQGYVNQAMAGDLIILRSGDHYVTNPIVLAVGKDGIVIEGEDGAILRKASNQNFAAMEIWGRQNVINNIELDGGMKPEAGIIIYGQENMISNSSVHNCSQAGIVLHNTGQPVCCYNTVIGCQVYYNATVGISQNGHCDGLIRDNQVFENGAEGITVDCGSHNNDLITNWVYRNNISNLGCAGIGIDASNGNYFYGNTIDLTQYKSGVCFNNEVGGCDGNILQENTISRNAQWGVLSEENPYYTTNTGFWSNTFVNNAYSPDIYFR